MSENQGRRTTTTRYGRVTKLPTLLEEYEVPEQKKGTKGKKRGRDDDDDVCNINDIKEEINNFYNNSTNNQDINTLINKFEKMNFNSNSNKRFKEGGGFGIPISGSIYFTTIVEKLVEIENALIYVYDKLYSVLEKGLELLEFLSNKNSCLEEVSEYLVGKNITKLIEYCLIGAIFMGTNALE